MSQPVVSLSDVYKAYSRGGNDVDVLQGIDFAIASGEFVSLMGPSGSGKTTLLNLVAGLDQPSQGDVWCAGHHISHMSEATLTRWRAMHLGFIFQSHHLIPVLTAYENVELPLFHFGLSPRRRREQVLNVLDLVGLAHRTDHRPGQLSGGEQQRVGIARALVSDPDLIVADEPTGDLDVETSDEILCVLVTVQQCLSKTILLVTHDAEAAKLAQRHVSLRSGRLVENVERSKPQNCKS